MRWGAIAALALAGSLLAACGDDDQPRTSPDPDPSSPTTSSAASGAPSAPASPSAPSGSAGPAQPGGTADRPAALTPTTAPLDWTPVKGSVDAAVTRAVGPGGTWTLSATDTGAELTGPRGTTSFSAPGRRVAVTLLDQQHAVVVLQDEAEERPSIAKVTDLATGRTTTLDGRSDVPTTNGGSWALGDGMLLHGTLRRGSYCLASVDLATQRSTVAWCAPKRHGFSDARIGPGGTSLLTFDDGQPSCRTVGALAGSTLTPFPGVAPCKGWDGLLVDDGAVWSSIPQEQQVETADFFARSGDQYYRLGPGTSGSLTWCGDAAWFVRDPQTDGGPAELMRWTPQDGLSVAYQSPKGEAFLEDPRCGGTTLTVTARTSTGDAQVTTDL